MLPLIVSGVPLAWDTVHRLSLGLPEGSSDPPENGTMLLLLGPGRALNALRKCRWGTLSSVEDSGRDVGKVNLSR